MKHYLKSEYDEVELLLKFEEICLESVHNVYAQLQGENQQLKDELADALVHMKQHLQKQLIRKNLLFMVYLQSYCQSLQFL